MMRFPAVLLEGNVLDSDPGPVPSTAFDCTRAIADGGCVVVVVEAVVVVVAGGAVVEVEEVVLVVAVVVVVVVVVVDGPHPGSALQMSRRPLVATSPESDARTSTPFKMVSRSVAAD